MRVFIAGVDGYLGWPLAQHLIRRGHEVAGMDCFMRRAWVAEFGSQSATPIRSMSERLNAYKENFGKGLKFYEGNLCDYDSVVQAFVDFKRREWAEYHNHVSDWELKRYLHMF